jgi:hypothetical protein
MHVVRNNRLEEVEDDSDVDFELPDASRQVGSHINQIPLQSAVQTPRLFYGSRFVNQALAIDGGESPLVQNLDPLDPDGRSFDEKVGESLGAVRAKAGGRVIDVTKDAIKVQYDDGTKEDVDLYNGFSFNQKSVAGATPIMIRRNNALWSGAIEDYEWADGDETIAYDPETLRSAWQTVLRKVSHENTTTLLRVSYASGREVVVTEDHSLLHFDGACIAPIQAKDCLVGVTRSPLAFGIYEGHQALPDDFDRGLLVGLYLAEGDLPTAGKRKNISGCVRIAVTGEARRKQVDDLFERLGYTPHLKSAGRASFHDRDCCEWLHAHCGRGAGNKFIHNDFLSASKDFRLGMIQGFMAGDGCMESDSNGTLHVHSAITSERLRDGLVDILNGFGIFTTLFFAGRRRYSDLWNDAFGFRVMSQHLAQLDRWFFYDDRHADYENWKRKGAFRASKFERLSVPVSRAIIPELTHFGLQDLRNNQGASLVTKTSRTGGLLLSKHHAANAHEGAFKKLGVSDLLWDIVESVEVAKREPVVYDLSVANAQAFAVCGGLLVHNSGIDSRSLVQKGSVFAPKQMLAASSYTDDSGTQNMGLNARIGLAAWKGFSMDDAVPISESFAKRLSAIQYKVIKQPAADNLKTGLSHYRALFPSRYTKEQLAMFDDNGVVKPGTVLKPGDPVILATMPRTLSSGGANIGKLSKALRQSRRDATSVWEGSQEAEVLGARKTRNGVKVVMRYKKPTSEGDKIVLRAGAKATVSKIIPDDRMPHTEDGVPLDMILNPLSLVSRANPSSQHEVRLGNVAKKLGRSLKIPSFLPKGENWNDYITKLEQDNGVVSTQKVFDPEGSRWLTKPITVGHGYVLKLHHTSESKSSARGVASYDQNQQPARGGGDMAQAKRFSGLENYGALSGGAYALMRENSTLRGQRNDDYWRSLRTGKPLPKVGVPFVWNKFRALLSGAGISTKEVGRGRFRLAPFVDKDLDDQDPIDIENGEIVNSSTLAPIPGGLFDSRVINGDRWGRIKLPRPVINPSMEDAARVMLGMTKNQMEEIIQGRAELPEALKSRLAMVAPRV